MTFFLRVDLSSEQLPLILCRDGKFLNQAADGCESSAVYNFYCNFRAVRRFSTVKRRL